MLNTASSPTTAKSSPVISKPAVHTTANAANPSFAEQPAKILHRYNLAGLLIGTGLSLSADKVAAVEERLDRLVAQREALEASLATRNVVSNRQVLIAIPPYKKEGEQLLNEFQDSLTSCLSPQEKEKFLTSCGPGIKADNSYYGIYSQQILVDATDNGYRLVHSYYGRSGSNMGMSGGLVAYNYADSLAYLSQLLPSPSN